MERIELTATFVHSEVQGNVVLRVKPIPLELLREFVKQHPQTKARVRVLFEPYDYTKQSRKLFFAIRDRILGEQSGMWSKSEADTLKEQLKEEFGARTPDGKLKSLKNGANPAYTRKEMWDLNQGAMQWAEEAGAKVNDLLPDYYEIGKEV